MRVAPLRERLLAALIDAALAIVGIAVVAALGIGAGVAYAHVRARDDEDEAHQDEEEDEQDVPPSGSHGHGDGLDAQDDRARRIQRRLPRSLALRAAVCGAGTCLAIGNRNWRSPGFRVVGLRRVDAHTGGALGVRSVLIGALFDQARQAATRPLFRSRARRGRERLAELAPKVKEIEHKYRADPQARQRAVMELYKANQVSLRAGCGWQVAGPILSQFVLGAGAIRTGRTAYDRLTGTIVVSDR